MAITSAIKIKVEFLSRRTICNVQYISLTFSGNVHDFQFGVGAVFQDLVGKRLQFVLRHKPVTTQTRRQHGDHTEYRATT